MSNNYLNYLPISLEQRKKIAHLGAPNAAGLLSLIYAAPDEFKRYIGDDCTRQLIEALKNFNSEAENISLNSPIHKIYATGAILDPPPTSLQAPQYNIYERDTLFKELQNLKEINDDSPLIQKRIVDIENRLNDMLDSL